MMKYPTKPTLLMASLLSAHTAWSQSASLEEVVVTAQFKTQSLQDAGLAIDAFDADRLIKSGVSSAEDLTRIVPALTVTNGGGIAGQIYMRGVGNRANNNYLDPAIILTYDGVALARGSATSIGAFYDLERVEVLKGPQGTLYGKNATGGVLNIIPVKPQLEEFGGFISGGLGNYDASEVSGALNIPVGENSAFRVAGSMIERDGYNNDGTNDDDRKSVRAQFFSQVTDDLSVRIAGDYTDVGGTGAGTTPVGRYANEGLASYTFVPSGLAPEEGSQTDAANAYRQTILAAPGFGFLNPIQDKWYTDGQLQGVNAEIRYLTDFGEFTFIPAWRKTEQDSRFGQPGFNSGWWQTDAEQKSMELRLSGEAGTLFDFIVGAYYFQEDTEGNNTFNQEFVLPTQLYEQEAESWAVFGQLTWKLGDDLRLITGARYTDDHKEMDGAIDNFITFCGGLPGMGFTTPPGSFGVAGSEGIGCQAPGNLPHFPTLDTVEQARTWLVDNGWAAAFIPIPPGELIPLTTGAGAILHSITSNQSTYDEQEPTYRLALEWDVTDDSMVYLSYESGYRSGGLQPSSASQYKPEYIDAYTIGAKNRFFDNRVQFNAELFYWDYKDQQISYFTLTEDGVLENLTDNVGAATNKGFDLDLMWLATENTLVSAKVQYLKASYDDLHFEAGPPRDNINCPFTIIGSQSNGAPALDFDCSDNDAIYSPEWTWQFGVEQTFPLGSMELIASIDTTWTDDQVTGFTNLPHEVIESHWRTNVDLTLDSGDGTWSASLYARNLEDDRRLLSSQSPLLGMAMASYGPDLTYGLRLNYNF